MKMGFLKFFFFTLISLITILPAFATDKVTLTGSVIGVIAEYKNGVDGKKGYYYRINTILQFKNESNEPLLILRPEWFPGTKRVAFTTDYSSDSVSVVEGIEFKAPYLWDKYYLNRQEQDKIGDFLRKLTGKEPTSVFEIIPVDGYYECHDSFLVENGFKTREEPDKKPYSRPRTIAIPEFVGFKIEYQLSIGDRPEGMDLLQEAKRKWSKFGNLMFDQDGKYSVKSSLILNMPTN